MGLGHLSQTILTRWGSRLLCMNPTVIIFITWLMIIKVVLRQKAVAISTLTINRSMIFFYYGLEGHTPITLLNLSNSFVKIRVINVLFLIAIVGEIQSFFVCLLNFIIIASLYHFLICDFLFIFDRIF